MAPSVRLTRGLVVLAGASLAALSIEGVLHPLGRVLPAIVVATLLVLAVSGRSGARGAVSRLSLAVAGVAALLVLLDVAGRWALAPLVYYRPHERFVRPWPPFPALSRYVPRVVWEGTSTGDLVAMTGWTRSAEPRVERFETDDAGFRNRPSTAPPRVLVLGDSYGAGIGTTQEAAFASLLARRTGLDVTNLSIPASPWEELVTLELEIDRLAPRPGAVLIWLLFSGNDLDDAAPEPPPRERLVRRGGLDSFRTAFQGFREHSPLRRLFQRARRRGRPGEGQVVERQLDGKTVLFFRPYERAGKRTREEVLAHENARCFGAIVRAVCALARERGLRLEVALAPSKEEVYGWLLDGGPAWSTSPGPGGLSEVVAALCASESVRFHDLRPAFVTASRERHERDGGLLWWRDDTHWNVAGHQVAADVLQPVVLGER